MTGLDTSKRWFEREQQAEQPDPGNRGQGKAQQIDTWDPPIPLVPVSVLPAFPTETLPVWLGEFIDQLAEATQTPPDMGAMFALAALATVAGGRAIVQPTGDWQEGVNRSVFVVSVVAAIVLTIGVTYATSTSKTLNFVALSVGFGALARGSKTGATCLYAPTGRTATRRSSGSLASASTRFRSSSSVS